MYLKFYRWITYLASPFVDLYLAIRKKTGKEDKKRFHERLGGASVPRPSGMLLWVHAASVGEAVSVMPLIKSLVEKYSKINVLITTGTVTSAKMLEKNLPPRTVHQYIPIDRLVAVRSFLSHWQPNVALWVESELWPNLIIETKRSGCTMIQVNARISENSYAKWKRARSLAEKMLGCFSLSLAQSREVAVRLEDMGARNVKYKGNLKFDAPPLPADPQKTGELLKMIGARQLWVAASTHDGEERIVTQAHMKLKNNNKDVLTIIVPRHPGRGQEILQQIKEISGGINVAIRSLDQRIETGTDIYIADTIGELGIFFRLAGVVFVGGSLVDHGGQNPLEAARLDCAIISGPNTQNFIEVYNEMKHDGAFIEVADGYGLATAADRLLNEPELQEAMSSRAFELVENKRGIVDLYLKEIEPYISADGEIK